MKVKEFMTLKSTVSVSIKDYDYDSGVHRHRHTICKEYDEMFKDPEIQESEIESIDIDYDDCYYEGDVPGIALYINYNLKPSNMDELI